MKAHNSRSIKRRVQGLIKRRRTAEAIAVLREAAGRGPADAGMLCTLGGLLAGPEEQDEGRYQQDAAADAEHGAEDPADQPDQKVRPPVFHQTQYPFRNLQAILSQVLDRCNPYRLASCAGRTTRTRGLRGC